ncbi:MAG: 4'-phosphopantetheinyl transferase superfamily protein [Oscillospiraceae bacterium]|nr:4'-phosphopantetheinyl transferase superfamily protein [Oscillospiraceae bacterium]
MNIKKIKIPEQFGSLYVCPVPDSSRNAEHETAHGLLKSAVQEYAESKNMIIAEENLILDYHEYEKPYFKNYPDLYFNLSHCDGLAVCLLSEQECGVDCEALRKLRPAVVRRVFSSEEQKLLEASPEADRLFTRIWTLKESYVKAIGRGIGFPMQKVNFQFRNDDIICSQENAGFCHIQYENYEISICILHSGV